MRGVERLLTVICAGGNIGHKLLSLMGWAGGGLVRATVLPIRVPLYTHFCDLNAPHWGLFVAI